MNTLSRLGYVALILVVGSALLPADAFAQGRFDNVEVVAHHVAGSVYYLAGQGGNIGVSVGEDGVVMIDDQFAPLTDKIVAAIRGISNAEIRFLINTHVHGDHTGGNENMGRMGILILARDQVRVRLAAQSPKDALPVLTYSDAINIHLNGGEVHAAPPLSANVRETRSTQRIRVGRRQRKRTCWDCEREWKRMVVPLEPGRPSEARQLLRTRR